MKRFLPMILGLLLCHCGTEVGNGIAPEPKKTGATEQTTSESAGAPPTQNDGVSGPTAPYIFTTAFIAACASPFAESIDGTFVNTAASTAFSVTLTTDGRKEVTYTNSSVVLTIDTDPVVGPYAIKALSTSPQVTCSAVTTETLSDGSLQRSVSLSNGETLQWTLTAGKVVGMKATTIRMSEETWTKR